MEKIHKDLLKAAESHSENYVGLAKYIAENAFIEGAEWAFRIIKQKLEL